MQCLFSHFPYNMHVYKASNNKLINFSFYYRSSWHFLWKKVICIPFLVTQMKKATSRLMLQPRLWRQQEAKYHLIVILAFIIGRYYNFWHLRHNFSIKAHLRHLGEVMYHTKDNVAITIWKFRRLQACFGWCYWCQPIYWFSDADDLACFYIASF